MHIQPVTVSNNYNKKRKQPAFGKMIIRNASQERKLSAEALHAIADNPAFQILTKKLDGIGKDLELSYNSEFNVVAYPHRRYYDRIFISARHKNSNNNLSELITSIDDIPKSSGVYWAEDAERLDLPRVLSENIKRFTEKDAIQVFDKYVKNKELENAKENAERESRKAAYEKIDAFNLELSHEKEVISDTPKKGLWQRFKELFT